MLGGLSKLVVQLYRNVERFLISYISVYLIQRGRVSGVKI